jgi:STE24 endopeptidase
VIEANPTTETVAEAEQERDLQPASAEVKRYQRQKLWAGLASLAITLLVLAIWALWLAPRIDPWLTAAVGTSQWLRLILWGFLVAASLESATLPLAFWSSFVLEKRHGLSTQSLAGWIWKQVKGWLIGGPLGLGLLLGLYALLWYGSTYWWLWAALGWLVVTVVLGQLLPVIVLPLFYKVTRLDDAPLVERLHRLATGTGLNVEGVYRLHLSAETRKANAALAGLGRTRRVLLGDTLLDRFSPEEIEVVFAHEVGHHVHRHLPKLIAANVFIAAIGLWIVDSVLHYFSTALGYASFDDPAALSLLVLVLMLFGLPVGPLVNAVSRFFERQCDQYALKRTKNPSAYRSAFTKLAAMNKSDPDPHPLVVWLYHDHPPIRERLAMAAGGDGVEG